VLRRTSQSDLRRILLAAVLVVLSLVAHAAAAGSLPGVTAIIGGAIVAGVLAWSLAGRRRSVTSLVGILFAGQLLMHAVVVALGHHGVGYLPDLSMTLAHLVAAGIAAVMFARGEQIVSVWVRAAARLLGAPSLSFPGIPSTSSRDLPHTTPVFSHSSFDVHARSRRGPPNLTGALTFA
jgi:hypothetical protein